MTLLLLVARTGRDEPGRGTLSLSMVDPDAPGLTRHTIETALEEPEKQFSLYLDDVEVPVSPPGRLRWAEP